MTNPRATVAGAALLSLLFSAPLVAHHSFSAQYDASKAVEMRGTVTKVEWTNPHGARGAGRNLAWRPRCTVGLFAGAALRVRAATGPGRIAARSGASPRRWR